MSVIPTWMRNNFLQLNAGKTDHAVRRCPSALVPRVVATRLGIAPVPKTVVKNLGISLDQKLTMKEQVTTTMGSCFHMLRLLRRVFPFLRITIRKTLIPALVISRLDYCNALLISANESSLNRPGSSKHRGSSCLELSCQNSLSPAITMCALATDTQVG